MTLNSYASQRLEISQLEEYEGDATMLSPTERDRLKNREGTSSQEKASNDARIKRKLVMWMKEDLDDVYLILRELPEDRLKRVLTDKNAHDLLRLAALIMDIKDFCPLVGKLDRPDDWKVFKLEKNRVQGEPTRGEERSANDMDVKRAGMLNHMLMLLRMFYEKPGTVNPVSSAMACASLLRFSELKDRVTEGEKRGIERITKAMMIPEKPQ
jgi:hypothetical protein